MNVMDAAYNVVNDYAGGSASLGPRIDKNATTLSHEVARVGTAKFGLETAVKVSVASKDYRILEAFATECGRMVLPVPELLISSGDDCLVRLGEVLRESGDVVAALTSSLADGTISENERLTIERECGHLVSGVNNLLAAVTARNLLGKPGGIAAAPAGGAA